MVKLHAGWKLYAGFSVALLILAITLLSALSAGMVQNGIIGGLVVALIITGAVVFFRSRIVAGGVGQIAVALKEISVRKLGIIFDNKSNDEIGGMAAVCQELQAYLDYMPWAAEHIADGSPTDEVKPKSDDDVRGNALAKMANDQSDVLTQVRESKYREAKSRSPWRPLPGRWGWDPGQLASSVQEGAGSTDEE